MGYLLERLVLAGYKSISQEEQTLEFGATTLLMGPNGAGKSNVVSFFRLLSYLSTGALQAYLSENGRADAVLFHGVKTTPTFHARLEFADRESGDVIVYDFTLASAVQGGMIFTAETAYWQREGNPQPFVIELGCGHRESGLLEASLLDNSRGRTAKFILNVLRACRSYCFHETSSAAKIRQPGYILDGNYLRSKGGNLAAYLLSLKSREGGQYYYEKIVRYVQRVLPQFADFVLIPMPGNSRYTELKWCTTDSQLTFGPQELSDGALRFMALGALLLQPPSNATNTIVIDGPEEALHPQTLDVLVDMVREASLHCKIILATQSLALLEAFGAESLLVLELDPQRQATQFYKLSTEQLQQRLARYRLGEGEQEA